MIAIIKYNAGNIISVQNALTRLGYDSIVTDNEKDILNANKIIFPGVGEASSAMLYLKSKKLDVIIQSLQQPVLGICLGQQLLCKHSEEGNTTCLGIFNTYVKKFPTTDLVPHMGWNNLEKTKNILFLNTHLSDNFYFAHSYYSENCEETIAICNYILPFSAALQKNNFHATQFHPEKSSDIGEKVLQNFLSL